MDDTTRHILEDARSTIRELRVENETLKATIGTPEVYYGVIDEVIALERETLAKQVADLTSQLEIAKAFHDVAVSQRNLAWAEIRRLKGG